MRKIILIVIIIILVLAGFGIGRWTAFNKTAVLNFPDKDQVATSTPAPPQPANIIFNGTVRDLLTKRRSLRCTGDIAYNGKTQKQIVYCDAKNLRLDILPDAKKGTNISYAIIVGGWQYMWDDAGGAVRAKEYELQPGTNEIKTFPSIIPNIATDYSCSPWVADASMFEIPPGFIFKDITDLKQK
jgi:hypothetical protein